MILPRGEPREGAEAPEAEAGRRTRPEILRYASFRTDLGTVLVTRTDAGLRSVTFSKDLDVERALSGLTLSGRRIAVEDPIGLRFVADAVRDLLKGRSARFRGRLDLSGATEFTKKVVEVVSAIPYGTLRSYKWVARAAGSPRAARAVGQVLSRNPLPIVVPCHRVVMSDGSLGGYSSGGTSVKRRLIEMENGQLGLEFAGTEREARERIRFVLEGDPESGRGKS